MKGQNPTETNPKLQIGFATPSECDTNIVRPQVVVVVIILHLLIIIHLFIFFLLHTFPVHPVVMIIIISTSHFPFDKQIELT